VFVSIAKDLDPRTFRVHVKTKGTQVRLQKSMFFCDNILAPFIDTHVTGDSLRERPIMKLIFPESFYRPPPVPEKPSGPQQAAEFLLCAKAFPCDV
jgi:hypothetical protein